MDKQTLYEMKFHLATNGVADVYHLNELLYSEVRVHWEKLVKKLKEVTR